MAQVGADVVGDHVAAVPEGEDVATHYFACTQPGYPGWRWAVTVVALPDQETTVDEVVLLPGDEAIIAPPGCRGASGSGPATCPPGTCSRSRRTTRGWSRRTSSGDPGDGAPRDPADVQQVKEVSDELGLGRVRVLSLEGRDLAAQRWYDGEQGPDVPLAQSAPAKCWSCGFLVRLAGPLADTFGVCANEYANDDGRVVASPARLRCPLRGPAAQEAAAAAAARPGLRHAQSEDDFERF